ncbi:MAG: carbohydrate kinase family protein [Alphaproteobacteria bacterium]
MTALRALVAGSVTIDTIAVIAEQDIERITMHNDAASFLLVEQGRKVQAESISTHVGGGAANVAVSLQRQGLASDVLGLTGVDHDAEKIRRRLADEGVGLAHLGQTAEAATGSAIHVSAHDHDAAIFVQRGANTLLRAPHVQAVDFSGYDLVYAASLSNESASCFPAILEKARAAGAFAVSNPGVRQIAARPAELLESLHCVDLLALNSAEAAALIPHLLQRGGLRVQHVFEAEDGAPELLVDGLRSATFRVGLPDVMSGLNDLGPGHVMVTDGANGAYLLNDNTLHYCPTRPAEVRGTAGAGDAFTSTVAAQIVAGSSAGQALMAASMNAASVVSHVDTQTGLLRADELATVTKAELATQSWPL